MRTTAVLSVALMLGSAPARSAEVGAFTEHLLYKMCVGDEQPARTVCLAYLRGMLFGIRVGQAGQKTGYPMCLPSQVDPETARLVIKKFIEDNPKTMTVDSDSGGDSITLMALVDSFQCGAPKKP